MTKLKEEVWVTVTDDHIPVKDMDISHLRNTLRMLIKQIRTGDLYRLGCHQRKLQLAHEMAKPLPDVCEEDQLRHEEASRNRGVVDEV